MKKLLLITILIGGCATTVPQYATNDMEQEGICKIDYRDQYWGDCYIRAIKADPNFSKVRAFIKRNYPSSNMQYNLLHRLNEDLLKRLAGNVITIDEANKSFKTRLDRSRSVTDREFTTVAREKEEKRQETNLKLRQLSEGLSRASATLSGNNSVNNQNNRITPVKLQVSYQLKTSFIENGRKVCVYSYRTHTQSWATSTLVSCPTNKYFPNPE